MGYLYLAGAILTEVIGTLSLKASHGFTRIGPVCLVVIGYACAFVLMSLALRHLPLGFVYAVWAGLGIVLVALAGAAIWGETIDGPAILGMALIICGVAVMQLWSKSAGH
jgi:small multidrug resistance pump